MLRRREAVNRGAQAIVQNQTRMIDVDVAAFFDTVRPDVLLGKVARRVHDGEILRLVKPRRARTRGGFGWTRWSTAWLHEALGLFGDYRVQDRANA